MTGRNEAALITMPDGAGHARPRSLLDLIAPHGRTQPQSVALIDDNRTLTWAQLLVEIAEMADSLRARGIGPGTVVAVADNMSNELVSLYFATAQLGAVVVPLNTNLAAPVLASYITRTNPRLVLVGRSHEHLVPPDRAYERIITSHGRTWGAQLRGPTTVEADLPDHPVEAASHLDAPHLVIFTSGTAGVPKAAVLSQRATWSDAQAGALAAGLRATDRLYCYQAPYHTGSWAMIRQYLLTGGSVVLSGTFNAERAVKLLQQHRCTSFFAVPLMLEKLVKAEEFAHADLSAFRHLVFASFDPSLVIAPVARMFRERGAARLTLEHIYGMTENSSLIATARAEFCEEDLTSVGVPVPGVSVSLRHSDGSEARTGEIAEICVRSPSLMIGYLDDPEATADAFRGGWLHTGDLGKLDERGRLHIVGRLKEMVRTGGVNVYPREVAAVLTQHPRVVDCAVFGVPDGRYDERLVAAVVPDSPETTETEIIAFVRRRLAGYQTPRQIIFVSELPKSATGKTATAELISWATQASCSADS